MSNWYEIGLDTDQLRRDSERAKQMLNGISEKAVSESGKIDDAFNKIGKYATGYFSIQAAAGFIKQVADIRGEFQKLEVGFTTMLGSKDKSTQLMAQMVDTAAKTPFTLQQVADGAKQLLAYQFAQEDVNKTLIQLGNISAGLGVPLDRLILVYGQVKAKGKLMGDDLRQFTEAGVPMIHELAKQMGVADGEVQKLISSGKIGFPQVQKVIENLTGAGGMFYNLMEEQSKTITGQISNLEDAWTRMLNSIGEGSQGMIADTISGVTDLVNNYETVGKVILGLVATYGAYKAAVLVVNALNALQAQIAYQQMLANIGNTGATIQLTTAQGLQAVMMANLTRIQLALNKSMLANPYVLAAMAITGLVIAMTAYANSAKDAITQKEILNDLEGEAQKNTAQEVRNIESLKKILNDTNKSYGERKIALDKLKEIVPDYHASLTDEGVLINNNSAALDTYVKKLVIAEKIKIAAAKQSNADEAFNSFKEENKDVLKNALRKKINGDGLFAGEAAALETWKKLGTEATNYGKVIDQLQSDLIAIEAKKVDTKPVSETPAQKKARLAEEAKAANDHNNKLADYDKERLEQQKQLTRDEMNLLRSKITDKKDLIDLEYEQALDAINEDEKLFKKKAQAAGIKNPDLSIFNKRRDVAKQKKVSDKLAVDIDDEAQRKKELDELLAKYQSFNQKKLAIDKQYDEESKKLVNNPENLSAATDAYKKNLEELKKEVVETLGLQDLYAGKGSEFLNSKIKEALPMFTDLAHATKSELTKVKDVISKIEVTPEMKQMLLTIGMTEKEVDALIEKLKKLKNEGGKAADEQGWKGVLEDVKKLSGSVGSLGDALSKMGGSVGEIGAGLSGVASSMGDIYTAMTSEDPMEVVSSGINGLVKLVTMVADQIEANKKAQEEWNQKIEESTHLLAMARIEAEGYKEANVFGVENPYEKAITGAKQYTDATKLLYEQTNKLANGQVQTGTKKVVSGANVGTGVGAGAAVGAAVGSIVPVVGTLLGAGIGALVGGIVGTAATKTVPVMKSLKDTYGSITQEIDGKLELNPKILADYDKLDESTKKLVDNWKDIKAKQEEAQKQMEDNFKTLAGDLGKSLSDALVEAFANGDLYSAIDKFDAKVNEVISNIVQQLIFSTVFQDMFDKLQADMTASFGAGGDNNIVDDIENFNKDYKKGLDEYGQAMTAADEAMKKDGLAGFSANATRTASSKGIASASQDSVDELNGRFTAIQGHTFNISEGVKNLQIDSAQALKHLAGIEVNTSRLESIETNMSLVKDGINQLNNGIVLKR